MPSSFPRCSSEYDVRVWSSRPVIELHNGGHTRCLVRVRAALLFQRKERRFIVSYNCTLTVFFCLTGFYLWCGRTTSARKAHLRMILEGGVRRGVGPRLVRLLVLMVRLMAERYFRALSQWKCYAQCSRSPPTVHHGV